MSLVGLHPIQTAETMAGQPARSISVQLDEDEAYIEEFDALLIGPRPDITSTQKYPAKSHARKVAQKLGVEEGLIYLVGKESELFPDSDMGPQFRQHRYFYYFSGVNVADCLLTYDIAEDFLQLYIPTIDEHTAIFMGPPLGVDEAKAKYEVDDVAFVEDARGYIIKWLWQSKGASLYVLHPSQIPSLTPPSDSPASTDPSRLAAHALSPYMKRIINHTSLLPATDAVRIIKDEYEIAAIRKANELSTEAHHAVLRKISKMTNETEIEAVFQATCIAANAKHQSYPVIAGSGPNAATLHYDANNESLEGRQLVCLDAGAEWKCYASDVTRTFPISGHFTPEAKAIYSIVEKMQEACIRAMRPGLVFRSLQVTATVIALQGLMALGLVHNGTFFDYLKSGVCRVFFPHGLGHHVGLEVHDVDGTKKILSTSAFPGNKRMKRELYTAPPEEDLAFIGPYGNISQGPNIFAEEGQKLEPGMILTVEPGIYFSRYAIENYHLKNEKYAQYINVALLEKYYPVGGVRIEDDILVTTTGYENLTMTAKGEAALKIIRGEE